jgi:hypothetical protein
MLILTVSFLLRAEYRHEPLLRGLTTYCELRYCSYNKDHYYLKRSASAVLLVLSIFKSDLNFLRCVFKFIKT